MKKVLYMNPILGTLIICAVMLVTRIGVFAVMNNDKKNDVVIVQDAKQDGYELQPGYASITASRSKVIEEGSKEGWYNGLKIISLIFCFLPLVWLRFFDGAEKGRAAWALFAFAIVWFVASFAPTAIVAGRVELKTKICLKDYQQGKNYDYLFPETKEQTQALGEFLKTCK